MTLGADFAFNSEESQSFLQKNGDTLTNKILVNVFNNWVLLIVGFVVFLFGTIMSHNDSKKLKEENKKLQDLENLKDRLNFSKEENEALSSKLQKMHDELVRNWLKTLYNNLNLTSYERFSIYFVHKEEFTLLARYSSNPKIQKIRNQKFPLNTGVISLCWQHGEYKEDTCPDFEENAEEYYKYMEEKYSYNKEKIDRLTMKSNKYFGVSIKEADDTVGVVLYESYKLNDKENFDTNSDKIRRYCKRYESYLSKFVKDAIQLNRESNVKTYEEVDLEALKILGGKK